MENYSKFKLEDPKTAAYCPSQKSVSNVITNNLRTTSYNLFTAQCGIIYKRSNLLKIIEAGNIDGGEFGLIAFDNQGRQSRTCGAVSWQMLNENNFPWRVLSEDGRTYNGRRLNIGYRTYHK